MADSEAVQIRPPEPISITVCRARNLRGLKGDSVNTVVKVEFSERLLGESSKVDCTPDVPAEFNFTAILNCTFEDSLALDEIAHKPVVLTVIEVLPKERRQKEEKTQALGQCTVDLLPLVKGEKSCSQTLTINPLPASPLETIPVENPRPEVDVLLSVNEPLLDEQQLKDGNLMTITVESLFSVPETWQMTGSQFYYSAALPVPVSGEKEVPIVFPGGILKPGSDKELPNKQKKWAVPGSAVFNSVYIPDSFIASDPIEDEDGDLKANEDKIFRHVSETEKLRITWNTERRCYLEPAAVKSFQDSVAKYRYWPVEIFRLVQPSGAKGKKDEESTISFHGVAFLNFSNLLYPGVHRIRGAYRVHPFSDNLLNERTKRKSGIGDESARLALNQLNRSTISPSPKKVFKDKEAEKKDIKKGAAVNLKSDTGSDLDSHMAVNVEGQQYAEAKSYITIDITLARPLVPKRQPEELSRRVAELIPPRPAFPKRTDSADKAVEDFRSQIAGVAALVLEEFRNMFGKEMKTEILRTNEAMEERRQKLLYHLNSSGKYFSFKEQLKHSVIKIVREKYLKTTNFDDRQQLQTFLSELYVYLIDQMHQSLNNVLQIEDQPPLPSPLTTNAQLKHFAHEAEVKRDFDLATKYYQERIIREENNADNWFDFGTFCLYINNIPKAEECLHKCISINQKHIDGLMLYGVICALAERNEEGETFLETATNVDPKSVLTWTLLGLFYDAIGHDIGAEMAYAEANRLNVAQAVSSARAATEEEQEKEKEKQEKIKAEKKREVSETFEDDAMDTKLSPRSPVTSVHSFASNKGDKKQSANLKGRSLGPSQAGSFHKGSVRSTPATTDAEHPEELPACEPTPVPAVSIYMRAVEWLLEVKAIPFTEQALAHELLINQSGKTPAYHIATAQLNLQKQDYEVAAQHLSIAVQKDHQNPDAWALMGHVHYLKSQHDEARECYEHTLSFVSDASEMHSIYLRLASIYLQEGEFQKAKQTFLMACKKSPSCISWLGVGIACYRLGELDEAEDALMEANILNNTDAEVWGYLSLVCLRTARKVEAEQSYRHAIKLQLQDATLLDEIHTEQKKAGFGNPEF